MWLAVLLDWDEPDVRWTRVIAGIRWMARAVVTRAMPLNDIPHIADAEPRAIAIWVAAGAQTG